MSELHSAPYPDDEADLADPWSIQRGADGNDGRLPQDGIVTADLPLRTFSSMSPTAKKSEDNSQGMKLQQERHHRSPNAHHRQRPKSSGRKGSGDRLVVSRAKTGTTVVRRLPSSSEPNPATVEHAEEKEPASTRAVDSKPECESPLLASDRISSTTFVAKTATGAVKARSGSPTNSVDPSFLSELDKYEKRQRSQVIPGSAGSGTLSSASPVNRHSDRGSSGAIRSYPGQAAAAAPLRWSPRSHSSSSSLDSTSKRSVETRRTSLDPSVAQDDKAQLGLGLRPPSVPSASGSRCTTSAAEANTLGPGNNSGDITEAQTPGWRYGTPEMARGHAKLPILSPDELKPRQTIPGVGHPKHLPRAEKLPMSGYELLASKLATAGAGTKPRSAGPRAAADASETSDVAIKPIYRRFEALNHRLLLHLQDELSELEEQLHRLDTADTQTRRLQNSILPASRRAESAAAGELQWHKTDILSKIGSKLNQYNQALASFSETQRFAPARLPDIQTYRSFFSRQNPIVEIETRFLDSSEDLISLGPQSPVMTPSLPYPRSPSSPLSPLPSSFPTARKSSSTGPNNTKRRDVSPRDGVSKSRTAKSPRHPSSLHDGVHIPARKPGDKANRRQVHIAMVAALTVLLPILAFRIMTQVSDLAKAWRVAVVLLIGLLAILLRYTNWQLRDLFRSCITTATTGDVGIGMGEGNTGSRHGNGSRSADGADRAGEHKQQQVISSAADLDTVAVAYGVVMAVVAVLF